MLGGLLTVFFISDIIEIDFYRSDNMSKRKATIYDVAKKCNVSPATVSRVINNSNYPVSAVLRNLVLDAAKELNYTPNILGKELRTKKNTDIGVIVPNISNSYYAELLQGIADEAAKNDFNIIVCLSNRDSKTERNNISLLYQKRVSGIIIASTGDNRDIINQVIKSGTKVLSVEEETGDKCSQIRFDYYKGMYMLCEHLIKSGHRNIGFVSAPLVRESRIEKLKAYKDCLAKYNIPYKEEYVKISSTEKDGNELYEYKNGRDMIKEFLKSENIPTAFVCINDITAFGVIKELRSNGYKIPDDFSVAGYDNISYAELSYPALTTVDQCTYHMGVQSVRVLIDEIVNETSAKMTINFEPNLIIRDSTNN